MYRPGARSLDGATEYEFADGRHQKVPQVGTVVIGDDVEIGANSTLDRARFSRTVVGEGTKIVFTGDPYQIDNPYVDAESNGLTWLVERFKGQRLAGHITLLRGECAAKQR